MVGDRSTRNGLLWLCSTAEVEILILPHRERLKYKRSSMKDCQAVVYTRIQVKMLMQAIRSTSMFNALLSRLHYLPPHVNARPLKMNAVPSFLTLALEQIQLRKAPPATTRFCLVNLTLYTGLFLVGNALI